MAEEVKFRTAVGGYRKEDVLEYVENTKDELFRMKKQSEELEKGYQKRLTELERLLKQEQFNQRELEQKGKTPDLKEENLALKETLAELEKLVGGMRSRLRATETEKEKIKEKLAREIIRQRREIRALEERVREAEAHASDKAHWEAVQEIASEVQFNIAEYVNAMNKVQQSLAASYQKVNGIKKQISNQREKAEAAEEPAGKGAALTRE